MFISGNATDAREQIYRIEISPSGRSSNPEPLTAISAASWSLDLLETELRSHKNLLEEISATFKLWCLGLDCFGITRPSWANSAPVFDFESG
jgi:hypothetical protein